MTEQPQDAARQPRPGPAFAGITRQAPPRPGSRPDEGGNHAIVRDPGLGLLRFPERQRSLPDRRGCAGFRGGLDIGQSWCGGERPGQQARPGMLPTTQIWQIKSPRHRARWPAVLGNPQRAAQRIAHGRAWHAARALALGPALAASRPARRPYDLRHAALSLWLNAGGDPAQIAARPGNSVAVLLTVYSHCIHGRDDVLNQQINHVLGRPQGLVRARPWKSQRLHPTAQFRRRQRLHQPRDGRARCPLYVRGFPAWPANGPQITSAPHWHSNTDDSHLPCSKDILEQDTSSGPLPDPAHDPPTDGPRTARPGMQKPVTPSGVTGFDPRKQGGRCWVRTSVG